MMPRNLKYWKRRFGNISTEPYHHHFDARQIVDLDDDGLAYLLTHVKGINMLDLNETEITNRTIKWLTRLEYINELRIKGCIEINNDCIADLNKIQSLTFLHVKNTGINIQGLLQLTSLTKITEILFSHNGNTSIHNEMMLLKNRWKNCSFIINGVPYIFVETQ